jgi:hypothetical protein
MACIPFFSPKRPNELVALTFDFKYLLSTGETFLDSGIWNVAVYSGEDASPSSMIVGTPNLSGTELSQRVEGGVDTVIYLVTCKTDTSFNQTFEGAGLLKVTDEC